MLGRRLLDLAGGSGDWTDATGNGAGEPAFVVVTSSLPESVRLTDLDWTFVTTGLPDAVAAARAGGVGVGGPGRGPGRRPHGRRRGHRIRRRRGLVDTPALHLAPVVLGAGTPLSTGRTPRTFVPRSVIATSAAMHLTYDFPRP